MFCNSGFDGSRFKANATIGKKYELSQRLEKKQQVFIYLFK
jgi:hypothetical protein